jgi:hypothetical protein
VLWGDTIILLLFNNHEYAGHGHTITILALSQLAFALGMPPANALINIDRSRLNFWIACISLILMLFIMYPLATHWSALGAAYALLIGTCSRSAARWMVFLLIARRPAQATQSAVGVSAVNEALQQFIGRDDVGDVTLSTLDARERVFLAHGVSAKPKAGPTTLVVKLCARETGSDAAVSAHSQFNILLNRHSILSGREVYGWRAHIPVPLHVCESPPALVMTMAQGQKLADCLEDPTTFTNEESLQLAHAIFSAFRALWLEDARQSCLTLDDVLCHFPDKSISFVGSGIESGGVECLDNASRIARNLANVISEAAITAGIQIGPSRNRLDKLIIAKHIVRHFLATIPSLEEKKRWLTEVQCFAYACPGEFKLPVAFIHQAPQRGPGRALAAVWEKLIRKIAARRLRSIFLSLRGELSTVGASAEPSEPASTSLICRTR